MSYIKPKSQFNAVGCGCLSLVLVVFLAVFFTAIMGMVNFQQTDVVTVTDKQVWTHGHTSTYLIYCEEETFRDDDNWLRGKFNSSDFYGRIKVGKKYKFWVTGYRIPLLSKYRNIISYHEATQ